MNTHRVILHDLRLLTFVSNSSFLPFAVTPPAQIRDVLGKDQRIQILLALCTVRTVAVCTIGGIRVPTGMIHPVLALAIELDLFGVTHGTVDLATCPAHRLATVAHIRVALDA